MPRLVPGRTGGGPLGPDVRRFPLPEDGSRSPGADDDAASTSRLSSGPADRPPPKHTIEDEAATMPVWGEGGLNALRAVTKPALQGRCLAPAARRRLGTAGDHRSHLLRPSAHTQPQPTACSRSSGAAWPVTTPVRTDERRAFSCDWAVNGVLKVSSFVSAKSTRPSHQTGRLQGGGTPDGRARKPNGTSPQACR